MSTLIKDYKFLAQMIAILFLTFSIMVVIRYTITEMEYSVSADSFFVSRKVGNKMTVVCSIDLLTTIALVDKKTYKNTKEFSDVVVKFNYCQNIKAQSFVLVYMINEKKGMIEFEPNTLFVKLIKEAIENAKKNNEENKDKID